jgi:Leucine-rich repeat (LRR) protein
MSAHAAHVSASAQQKVYDAANKIAASPPSKFSSKVASAASRQGEIAPIVDLAQPHVSLVATVADEVAALDQSVVPKPVVVRSLAHFQELLAQDVARIPHVDLSRVDATTAELAALFQEEGQLHGDGALQALTIRHSIRGTLGIQEILKALAARTTSTAVTALDVSCNPASFSVGNDEPNVPCAEELTKYLAANGALRTLNLSSTGLGAAGAIAFPALKNHGGLTSLDVSRNAIGLQQDEAAVAGFISLVQENKFLLQLDLSDNEIGGALAKQLLDALRTSDTRVKTPEPEPEPEVEEYSDELPPEEEAPQVTVGFPEDDVPPPTEEAAVEGATEGAPAEEGEAPAPLDVTAEPEDDETDAAPAAEVAVEEAAEEEDPEAAEAARLEAEETAREIARQKEEAWRARMTQYIWDPEQILFQYKESVARREAIVEYSNLTSTLKKEEKAAKRESKTSQLHREQVERNRRSGWTHLQDINLSGNPIGNAGAKILALALRHKIPLSGEELQAAEESYEKRLAEAKAAAREVILKERAKQKADELAAAAAATAPTPADGGASSPPPAGDEAAEAEGDINAENVAVEDDAIPPPEEETPAVQDEEGVEEGERVEGEEEDLDLSHVQVAALEATRPGIQNIRGLRLDSCSVGAAGLKALAEALNPTTCPSVTLLSLRRNKFAIKKESVPVAGIDDGTPKDEAEDDGEAAATVRVDVPGYVSVGVIALSESLRSCANLIVLDLGWNRMYPESIRTLAAGIRDNKTLTWLGLDGNNFGYLEDGDQRPSALSVLLEAVATQGLISTLLLGSCELEGSMKETEITLLATIPELRHLSLSGNQLTSSSVAMWGHIVLNLDDDVPRTTLATLSLENIVSLVGEDGGAAVASVLQGYRNSLRALSLKSCQQLGDAGIVRVASKFGALAQLQRVNLSRCGIVNAGLVLATAVSQKIPTLVAVDISDNEIPVEEFQHALESMSSAVSDFGAVPPLEFVAAWSRSADSEDLLPAFQHLASVATGLQQCDTGIPPVFPKSAAAASHNPNVVYQDLFDELEKQCLKNRVASHAVPAA